MAIDKYTALQYYSQFDGTVPAWNNTEMFLKDRLVQIADKTVWLALRNNTGVMPSETATEDWRLFDFEGLGYNQFVTGTNIINNFMFAYVDDNTSLKSVKKSQVEYFAQQEIQEFSYDAFETKSVEYELSRGLTFPLPQDCASIIQISFLDEYGNERPVQPRLDSGNPLSPVQVDNTGEFIFLSDGGLMYAGLGDQYTERQTPESEVQRRYNANQNVVSNYTQFRGYFGNGFFSDEGSYHSYGKRYYLNPELANINGTYVFNKQAGTISLDNFLAGRIIILKYVSDGLDGDLDKVLVPKIAEKAVMQGIYADLLNIIDAPANKILIANKARRAALRNAKLRLQRENYRDLTQTLRNKNKWIQT